MWTATHALHSGAHADAQLFPAECQPEDEARQQPLALDLQQHELPVNPADALYAVFRLCELRGVPTSVAAPNIWDLDRDDPKRTNPDLCWSSDRRTLVSTPAWMRSSTRGTAMNSVGFSAATSSVIFLVLPCTRNIQRVRVGAGMLHSFCYQTHRCGCSAAMSSVTFLALPSTKSNTTRDLAPKCFCHHPIRVSHTASGNAQPP